MMGSPFSKKTRPQVEAGGGDSSSSEGSGLSSAAMAMGNSSSSSGIDKTEYTRELSSYEAACEQDPELQSFDSTLQQRTMGAISMLAGSELSSLSFDTLSQVTGCLLDNNQQVVNIILQHKKDIWKNPELFDLVEDYFSHSLHALDFCSSLEKCLMRARDSQLIIQVALQCFEEEEGGSSGQDSKKKYTRTMEELQHFKAAGDPFTEEFFRAFQSVYKQQISMLEKLQKRKRKLDKKLKTVNAWRRVSNIIFVSAFAALIICSVVAAVMAAPPVAAGLAAAASIPLGSMGKWIDSLWKNYSDVIKGEKGVISTMEVGTYVAISDLDIIRVLVERLETQISSLLQNVDFAVRDEDAVKVGIKEIKKKLGVLMKSVEDLGKQVDRGSRNIERARTVVLQRIIRHPK